MAGLPKDIPFTQVPNIILDEKLKELKSSELKIFILICRKTFGYQKLKDSISLSQMMKHTGLAKSTVIEAIRGLEKKGIVHKHTDKRTHQYSIKIKPLTRSNSPKIEPAEVQKSNPELVQKSDTQKKASKQKEKNTTTISSSEFSEDIVKVIDCWNQLFDVEIYTINGNVVSLIRDALRYFTAKQLCKAMKNRLEAPYYREKYGLRNSPKCFFAYPETIKNDLNRGKKDIFTYDQKVDRITSRKNKDGDFKILKDRLDSQGRPLWKLIR